VGARGGGPRVRGGDSPAAGSADGAASSSTTAMGCGCGWAERGRPAETSRLRRGRSGSEFGRGPLWRRFPQQQQQQQHGTGWVTALRSASLISYGEAAVLVWASAVLDNSYSGHVKFPKNFKISRHIECLDTYIEH
jgi:hypothetical protein